MYEETEKKKNNGEPAERVNLMRKTKNRPPVSET